MRSSCLTVSFPVSLRCGLAKRSVGSTGVQLTSPPVNVSAQFPPQHAFLWLWFTHSLVASSTCALQGTARQSCLTVAPHWTDWTLHINPRCGEDCGCAFFTQSTVLPASCRRTSPMIPNTYCLKAGFTTLGGPHADTVCLLRHRWFKLV